MGWLTPLLLKAKMFLQTLWHVGYDWDIPLSTEHEAEWKRIMATIDSYQQVEPRMVATSKLPAKLVLFADASICAMAACAYMIQNLEAHLVFAKSRLPSLKIGLRYPNWKPMP